MWYFHTKSLMLLKKLFNLLNFWYTYYEWRGRRGTIR